MAGPDCWLNYDSDKTCPRKEPYAFLCKWFWTRLKPSCCLCQRLGLPATLRLPMPSAQRWVLWKILHHCLWVTAWMQRFESGKLISTCWSWFMTCMKITEASRLSMILSTSPGYLTNNDYLVITSKVTLWACSQVNACFHSWVLVEQHCTAETRLGC